MLCVRISEEEDGLLERLHSGVHLVRPDVGFELGEVVHRALAVGGSDDERRVLPDVKRDLAPRRLDGRNGIGQCTVLQKIGVSL